MPLACGEAAPAPASAPAARTRPTVAPFVNDPVKYGDTRDTVAALDAGSLAARQQMRDFQGFSTSEEHIRALYADRSRAVERYAQLYTRDEAALIDVREQLQADGDVLMGYVNAKRLPKPQVTVDPKGNEGRGEVIVHWSGDDLAEHEPAIRTLLPHSDRVTFVVSPWSQQDLMDLTARTTELAKKYPHPTWQWASSGFDMDARPEVAIVGSLRDAKAFYAKHGLPDLTIEVTDRIRSFVGADGAISRQGLRTCSTPRRRPSPTLTVTEYDIPVRPCRSKNASACSTLPTTTTSGRASRSKPAEANCQVG